MLELPVGPQLRVLEQEVLDRRREVRRIPYGTRVTRPPHGARTVIIGGEK